MKEIHRAIADGLVADLNWPHNAQPTVKANISGHGIAWAVLYRITTASGTLLHRTLIMENSGIRPDKNNTIPYEDPNLLDTLQQIITTGNHTTTTQTHPSGLITITCNQNPPTQPSHKD